MKQHPRCKRGQHRFRFLKWLKRDEIVIFYCEKCLIYDVKWSDCPMNTKQMKEYYKKTKKKPYRKLK